MYSSTPRNQGRDKTKRSKKDKKLLKLITNSDSDTGNESEHELSYYMKDRVKLMKEVLKIIKPKKMKIMAPDCMKRLQIEEINSMLLEELLGISNKRLEYIFEGKNFDEESSTDEDQPIDVISLDDISDDDFVIISDDETDKTSKKQKRKKIKEEPKEKSKRIKKEKSDKDKCKEKTKVKGKEKERTTSKEKEPIGEENLMSVLELLELQARARAIRSQLDLESKRKKEQEKLAKQTAENAAENGQEDDEIIMEVPKEVEIVITSSDSENEENQKDKNKVSTSKGNVTTNRINASKRIDSINENTNNSNIPISEDSSQDNNDTSDNQKSGHTNQNEKKAENDAENRNVDSNDKEEGEVSDNETINKKYSGGNIDLLAIPVPPGGEENIGKNRKTNKDLSRTNSFASGSDSNDNLQVIMLREKKRKKRKSFVNSASISNTETSITENLKSKDSTLENGEKEKNQNNNDSLDNDKNSNETKPVDKDNEKEESKKANYDENRDTSSQEYNGQIVVSEEKACVSQPENDSDSQQSGSKIETAIAEFLKTQPLPLGNAEKQKNFEETKKTEKKARRIKNLKNKLQSFKKDVEGESSVTILENIVIKPKSVDNPKRRNKVAEDSDDLVINVDQDDLDCIVCD